MHQVTLFGVEDKSGKLVGLPYGEIQIISRKEYMVGTTTPKKPLKDSNTIPKDPNTIPKSEITTQKESLKDISTTQKDECATQKSESTTQKDLDATQKKVLEFFKNNPKGTRVKAANALGDITEDGVKFVIGKLQQKGLLKRVGGRKHGEWQVLI